MPERWRASADYSELGYSVDARLMNYAWGLEIARKYGSQF